MGLDLQQLYDQALGASQQRSAAATNEIGNVNNISGEIVNILQKKADTSLEVGQAQAAELEAKGARELESQAQRRKLEAAILNPQGAADLVEFSNKMSVKIAHQKELLDAERGQIIQKMNTKFSDDPLGWLTNAFTVPDEVRTYNAKYAGLKGEMAFQAKMVESLNNGLTTQKQLEATTSAEEVAAAAKKAQRMATVVALQSQADAMQASLTAAGMRSSLMNAKADSAKDMLHAALSMAANARAEEERADRQKARKESDKSEAELAAVLPMAYAAHGFSPTQGTVANWKRFAQVDKDTADSILKFAAKLDIVKDSKDPKELAGIRITDSPSEAFAMVQRGVPLQGNGAQAAWLKKIDVKTQTVLRAQRFDNGTKDFDSLPKAQKLEVYRSTFDAIAKADAAPNNENMSTSAGELSALRIGGESLATRVPGLARLMTANPAMKNKTYTPEEIIELARTDVALTAVAAAQNGTELPINTRSRMYQQYSKEIADLYTAKTQGLFTTVQPHLLGVPIDPNAKYDYTYKVPGFIFDSKAKADLKRPDHVLKVLLKEDTNGLK